MCILLHKPSEYDVYTDDNLALNKDKLIYFSACMHDTWTTVKCVYSDEHSDILASISRGEMTDGNWKCSIAAEQTGWLTSDSANTTRHAAAGSVTNHHCFRNDTSVIISDGATINWTHSTASVLDRRTVRLAMITLSWGLSSVALQPMLSMCKPHSLDGVCALINAV